MTTKKVYYIECCNDYRQIKMGYLISISDDGRIATIREPVDKYRPEHFHDIFMYNIKEFIKSDEIDFLNNMEERIHERLEDLWCGLIDIKENKRK